MLCHPQQIASTKTNLLLYDKRTCLGRNKLNLGVVIWVWCLHIWPMLHRLAELRVSNYYSSVLRIVQRDTEANGVFVQLTSPWGHQVSLGAFCNLDEALHKNLEGLSVRCCVLEVCSIEDGWAFFILGQAAPGIPTNIASMDLLMSVVLLCGNGLSGNSFAGAALLSHNRTQTWGCFIDAWWRCPALRVKNLLSFQQ